MMQHLNARLEIKSVAEGGTFSGYGSVFGNADAQNEVVAKGAFARTLTDWKSQGRSPALLWQHDQRQPIGVWDSLKEDANGLAVDGRLALQTQKGAEAYQLLKMGALSGLSIGYRTVKSKIDAQNKTRVLTDVDLFEVSLVTFPANDAARVNAVKAAQHIKTQREFEEFLRDEGFSHAEARRLAGSGFKGLSSLRDEGDGLDELAEMLKRNTAILQTL